MPRLTVKALAEMIKLPAHQQMKILHEQKFPKSGTQAFKVPYYSKSATTIRSFYKSNNDQKVIDRGITESQNFSQEHKRKNNIRTLRQFSKSNLSKRHIIIKPKENYKHSTNGVDIRVAFDICGTDGDSNIRSLFHFPAVPVNSNLAKYTLEFASWVLSEQGVPHKACELELVDIAGGKVHTIKTVRKSSIALLNENIKVIKTLWPEV